MESETQMEIGIYLDRYRRRAINNHGFKSKIIFESNAAVTIQEQLQFEKYFLKKLSKIFCGIV